MCVPFTQFPPVVSSCKTSKVSPPGCLIQSRYRMFPSPHTPSCCHVTQPHLLPSPRPFYLWQPPVSFLCYKLVIWRVLYKWNHTGYNLFSSVAQSCPTLQLLEPQHTRSPCPSPTPGVHPNPCPLSRRCHRTISSSVVPFSSCPQSFPASGSFPVNQLFASGGQSIGVSAWTSVLPVNTQDWSPLGWTDWISSQSKGLSRVFNTTVQKPILRHSAFSIVQLAHPYMTTGTTTALTRQTFV